MNLNSDIFKIIRKIHIRTKHDVQEVLAGAYHSAFKGRGMEFEDVREYQPGDEVRSIDWNVTARMQYPYVKNYREERELSIMLLIDVSASSHFGSQGTSKAKIMAEIAALFAFSAIQNNDKVGLILFTDQVERYLPPKKGKEHVSRIVREMLSFKAKSQNTNIKKALSFFGKVQKKKCVGFLISDFYAASFAEQLAIVGKRHDLIGVQVQDLRERQWPKMGLVQFRDLETQKVSLIDTSHRLVRKKKQKQYTQFCENLKKLFDQKASGLIPILSDQPYVEPINQFFKKRKARR